jgi:Flp pilus assembly protein TadD
MSELDRSDCPQDRLAEVIAAAKADERRGLGVLDVVLRDYPGDARLHFLRGSLLAGLEQFDAAREAMTTAVRLAPGFWVARFQLGFLELTSGSPGAADATWRPLDALGQDHPLRVFANGLRHLARDEFAECVASLQRGIALNSENPAINADMQLILSRLATEGLTPRADEPVSAAQLLLQQYGGKPTRH